MIKTVLNARYCNLESEDCRLNYSLKIYSNAFAMYTLVVDLVQIKHPNKVKYELLL